jgi:hypothetical protein
VKKKLQVHCSSVTPGALDGETKAMVGYLTSMCLEERQAIFGCFSVKSGLIPESSSKKLKVRRVSVVIANPVF